MTEPTKADVLIVGGGPVGTLLAYQLARFGCVPYIIEKDDKPSQPCYGRACTLWPRTVEILDQLDLAEALLQNGMVTRSGMHFHEGKRVNGGLMYGSRMDRLGDTFFKFALHIRQRITESLFADALEELGYTIHMNTQFESYTIDSSEYPIAVTTRNVLTGEQSVVRLKYLVGCDGGSSLVRSTSGIDFLGERTTHRWIRMDARVKCDMPNPRYLNSIDSASHGQILWCPIDSGLTRIGYVFSQKLIDKYGGIDGVTQEAVMAEAKEAVKPFHLEFEHVDWWTIYGIGQRIASTFSTEHNRVFLAGDACHTHSSGSAQGLNTGMHDAVNLGWKLALAVQGQAGEQLLQSYDEERRGVVKQVIDNDKCISVLISGHYPERFKGRTQPTRDILTEWFSDMNMQSFTLGIGIAYPQSILNLANDTHSNLATVNAGERGPDVCLSTIGTGDVIRLHQVLKNTCVFSIVVFAGIPTLTQSHLARLRTALEKDNAWPRRYPQKLFRWTTIVAASGNGGEELLGVPPPPFGIDFARMSSDKLKMNGIGSATTTMATRRQQGKVYLDPERKAHDVYGVDVARGCVVVFRPDGWAGAVVGLDEGGMEALGAYFAKLLVSR